MPLLLLDPLVLALVCGLAVYAWVVWTGRFRRWFAPERLWLGCWPLPVVVAVVPLLVGPVLRVVVGLGSTDGHGGLLAVSAYLVGNGVPIVWLSVAPPRWLLPPWARQRLAVAPRGARADGVPADAVPAVHAPRAEGGACVPRWRWRVDGEPGHLWFDDGHLRFRASTDPGAGPPTPRLEQSEVDQLDLRLGTEVQLEAPRGGWWTRRLLDVDLAALDEVAVCARRPWADDGLLTLGVEGRRPLRVWVTGVDEVHRELAAATPPA